MLSVSTVRFVQLVSIASEIAEFVWALLVLVVAGLVLVGLVVVELGRWYLESRQTMESWDCESLELVEAVQGEFQDLEEQDLAGFAQYWDKEGERSELFWAEVEAGLDSSDGELCEEFAELVAEREHYGESFSLVESWEFGQALEREFAQYSAGYAVSLSLAGLELVCPELVM